MLIFRLSIFKYDPRYPGMDPIYCSGGIVDADDDYFYFDDDYFYYDDYYSYYYDDDYSYNSGDDYFADQGLTPINDNINK